MRQISLNGTWDYAPQARVILKPDGSLVDDAGDLPPIGEMTLPANWQLAGLDNFHGRVRFSRSFAFDGLAAGEASVWLRFDGVDYFAAVWLNDRYLGEHAGYFQPFSFDVTDSILAGENHLVVEVTCPLEEPGTVWPDHKWLIKGVLSHWDCRPGSWDTATGQDKNSGGIWRDIRLETRSAAYLDGLRVQTRLAPRHAPAEFDIATLVNAIFDPGGPQQAIVQADVEIHGPKGRYELTVQIGDEPAVVQSVTVERTGQSVTAVVQIPEPKLWWTWDLGEPHLERCTVALFRDDVRLDEQQLSIGLREIRFDAERGEWFLNGKRVFIRGTNVVPTLWLSEYDDAMIARDIDLLRGAHVNGVRVCVHVNRPEFYAACDRAGIIVWQDFALQWGYVTTSEFMNEAVRQVKEMVRLLANHPCIGVWCCQNESSLYNGHVLGPVLADAIATEDSTRHIHSHSEFQEHAYPGWYFGHKRDYSALPGTPVLTEFGAQALPRAASMRRIAGEAWPPDWDRLAYHDFQFDQTFRVAGIEMGEDWGLFAHNSQTYQARLLKFAIERYRRAKYERLGGLFQFMFMECWPSITWAVVEYDRTPKAGYATLQEVFQPTLIGMDLDRAQIQVEADRGGHPRPLVVTPWVVNDRHALLDGCTYTVTLRGADGETTWPGPLAFDVPADAVLSRAPGLVIETAPVPGSYTLALSLHRHGEVISRNAYAVEIVTPP